MAILLLCVAGVYLGSLWNEFLWDDQVILVSNGFIKNLNNVKRLFDMSYFNGSGESSYRPVATLSYMLGHAVWGLSRPGFHAFSLVLHLLAGLSVFVFLRKVFTQPATAFWATALFLLHPINSEAVLEVSFNEELLCAIFSVLSFNFFIQSQGAGSRGRTLVLSLGCYTVALFSKEIAILLPLLLILYEWVLQKDSPLTTRRILWKSHFGYWFLSLFYLFVRFFLLRNPKELHVDYIHNSFFVNTLTMLKVFFLYLKQLVWPLHLSPDHFVEVSTKMSDPSILLALGGLAGMGVLFFFFFQRSRRRTFFFLWVVGGLLPVMNLIPFLKDNFMADRYLYFSSIGFCALVSSVVTEGGPLRKFTTPFLLAVLVGCALLTFRRTRDWRDAVSFWGRAVATDPRSVESHNRLGAAYSQRQEFEKAAEEYLTALRINPRSTRALNNLGNVYFSIGDYGRAIDIFNQSLVIDPAAAVTYANRGSAHKMAGQPDLAIADYLRAVTLKPSFAEVYLNLAMTYQDLGQSENMKKAYDDYLALRQK